jgi:hypothetical protein
MVARVKWWFLPAVAALCAAQAPPPAGFPGTPPEGPPPRIVTFEADPPNVQPGQSATLRWTVLNAFTIRIDPGIGVVATRGSVQVKPEATTTYIMSVAGSGGTVTRAVMVAVEGTRPQLTAGTFTIAPPRPVPTLVTGVPDLSGVWMGGRAIRLVQPPVLKPGAEAFRVAQRPEDPGPGAQCLPPGVPGATVSPYPLQIVQRPEVVVILYEAYNLFRIIPIGRDHPEDLDPTFMGHSVGRWEGDTLVVDATGFNGKTVLGGFGHTEQLHVVERYRRTAYDVIEYEALVEDPNVFAAPARYAGVFEHHPEWEIGEYVCAENNKDYNQLFNANRP